MKKRPFKKRSFLFIIPAVLLVGLLCFAIINALRIYIPQEKAQRNFVELKEKLRIDQSSGSEQESQSSASAHPSSAEDGGSQKAQTEYDYNIPRGMNPDYVGWLTIGDTIIDYPVMKSSEDDPEYYLHRDFYGDESVAGCLFIGGGCNSESKSFVIYGHNMNNGSMFGELDEYYDYNYAEEHRDISFFVNGEERIYRVFGAFQTKIYGDRDNVFKYYEQIGDLTQEEYEQTVEAVRTLSAPKLPYAPSYPAQLLFLSTCSYHTDDGRFVVAAYRIK